MKGKSEYTKPGYLAAAKHFNNTDLEVDCNGKSYMITGANSGIGKVTAQAIAKLGGTVHMVCRSQQRGEEARQEIMNATGNNKVKLHILDMSRAADVCKFAADFSSSGEGLNCLINNAGCMVNERGLTDEGYEKNFATNSLGTYILTAKLIPLLQKSSKGRVVIVTSGGMLTQKLDVKDLQFENMKPFDGTMAYAQNKRQQVIMTEQFGKMYPDVHFSTMHPGWADTPAVRMSMPEFYEKMKDKFRTAEQGADTLVWLAVSNAALQQPTGLFFQDRKSADKHLTLACSRSSGSDDEILMTTLKAMMDKCG